MENDTTIIPPFRTIDGLGDVVAKNIEAEAQKNPFISIEDFQNRCKVSQTLIEKICEAFSPNFFLSPLTAEHSLIAYVVIPKEAIREK